MLNEKIKKNLVKYVAVPSLCMVIMFGTIGQMMADAVELPVATDSQGSLSVASNNGVLSPEEFTKLVEEQRKKDAESMDQTPMVPDTATGDVRVEGGKYNKGDYTAVHTNFLSMRRKLEKLTGTTINGRRGYGPLYTGLIMGTGQEVDDLGYTKIQEFTGTNYYLSIYRGKDMQVKVRELASETFKDVTKDNWFASYIPEAVYHNMINGYEDGTFKGNNHVTFAEFAKMLTMAEDEDAYVDYNPNGRYGEFTGKWYAPFLKTIDCSNYLNINNIDTKMPRGLVAYEICSRLLYNEFSELYEKSYIGVTPDYWTDIDKVVKGYYEYDLGNKTYDKMREQCNNVKEVPENIYVAMELLRKYDIMVGDENQASKWNEPITRAEAMKLIIETYTNAWYAGVRAE